MIKRKILLISLSINVLLILISLVILFKPGAAVFYQKKDISISELSISGDRLLYELAINDNFYDIASIIVFEGPKQIELINVEKNIDPDIDLTGFLNKSIYFVRFEPASFNNLDDNTYQILFRPIIISRFREGILWVFLSLITAEYLSYKFMDEKRVIIIYQKYISIKHKISTQRKLLKQRISEPFSIRNFINPRKILILNSLILTYLMNFLYLLLEWLFIITKPSFLNNLGLFDTIRILFSSFFFSFNIIIVLMIILLIIDFFTHKIFPNFFTIIYLIPAAIISTCLTIILIDNFTYTIIKFGIITANIWQRIIYMALFLFLFFIFLRRQSEAIRGSYLYKKSYLAYFSVTLLIISLISSLTLHTRYDTVDKLTTRTGNHTVKLPNIILLGTDGLNADNMSVYGYERNTTPFLDEWSSQTLIGMNNFTNSEKTTGSFASILTGKSPFTTRLLISPNTLSGYDMFQHLPGLLHDLGYRTISLGVEFYVDATAIKMDSGFDHINCKDNKPHGFFNELSKRGFDNSIFLLSEIYERIMSRVKHIFFIENVENVALLIQDTQGDSEYQLNDQSRMECVRENLVIAKNHGQPLFAHIHLMGTHGNRFKPINPVFSKGISQDEKWMTDFYDDAILEFDNVVEDFILYLRSIDELDNTLVVIYSDHGQRWTSNKRIPLIFYFPDNNTAGRISENTQNLDIAPTIIDYLGFNIPTWMEGKSIFHPLDPNRIILIAKSEKMVEGNELLPRESFKRPSHQFNQIIAVQCQNMFQIDLNGFGVSKELVENYYSPCPIDSLDSDASIKHQVGKELIRRGYDLPKEWLTEQ